MKLLIFRKFQGFFIHKNNKIGQTALQIFNIKFKLAEDKIHVFVIIIFKIVNQSVTDKYIFKLLKTSTKTML